MVDEEAALLNTTATPQFIGAMTEMVWAQLGLSPLSPISSIPSLPLPPLPFLPLPILLPTLLSPSLVHPRQKFHWLRRTTENAAIDLEAFSRHAGRTTITTDDVLLMTRKNEALQGILRDFVEGEKEKAPKSKGKGAGKARGK